jgi:hypothetical protein
MDCQDPMIKQTKPLYGTFSKYMALKYGNTNQSSYQLRQLLVDATGKTYIDAYVKVTNIHCVADPIILEHRLKLSLFVSDDNIFLGQIGKEIRPSDKHYTDCLAKVLDPDDPSKFVKITTNFQIYSIE